MINKEATVSITKEALVVRIPWRMVVRKIEPRVSKSQLSVKDVLSLVAEGRKAHKEGKTRLIKSLAELQS